MIKSEIAQKINGMSSSSRSTDDDRRPGRNLVGGDVNAVITNIVVAASDVGFGILDSFHASGLAALGGAAFADIPKLWENSIARLPVATHTISLTSPYGNPISELRNLHTRVYMLPTRKQSWTSPFLVELYDQDQCQAHLCMVDQISIIRSAGNFGLNGNGKTTGIDVSFSVIDMSSVLHAPNAESEETEISKRCALLKSNT